VNEPNLLMAHAEVLARRYPSVVDERGGPAGRQLDQWS